MNENTITKELERVVHENLNEVELGVFKREMNRLQTMEVEFVQLREVHKELEELHKELAEEYASKKVEIGSILKREQDLEIREREMSEQKTQLHIDNQLIELRRANADQRVVDHQKMVKLIFRGPVFQKSVVENRTHDEAVPVDGSDTVSGYVSREVGLNASKTTTTTERQD